MAMVTIFATYTTMDNEKVRPLLDALRGIGLTVRELPDEREIEAGITEADGVVIFTSHSYFQVVVTLPDLEALLGRFPDKPVVFVRLNESAPVPRVPTHAAAIHIQERGTAELAEFIRDNLENPVICFAEPVSPSAEHEADSAALDVDMSVDIPDFGMLKDIPEIDVSEDSRSKHAENARECPPCKCTPEFEISYDLSTEGENFSVKASESFKSEAPDGECTPAAAGDASVPAGDEPATVILGVSAPQEVKPGEEFIADFLAYLPELEDAVREIVREQSPRAEMRPGLKKCRWKKGVRVQVKLSAGYFSVDPGEDEFEWDGTYQILSFGVEVPKDAETGPVSLKFDVSVGGIRIARLFAEVAVVAKVKSDARVTVTGKPASTAFASYASEDRQRIADRLAALRIHDGLDVFMDHLSLIPGEDWKERLVREIEARELFLLFWSPEAEKSEWVDWEWRTAFALKEQRELPEFEIHPLENGLTPPKELSHLHFGDVFMTIRAAAEQGEGG